MNSKKLLLLGHRCSLDEGVSSLLNDCICQLLRQQWHEWLPHAPCHFLLSLVECIGSLSSRAGTEDQHPPNPIPLAHESKLICHLRKYVKLQKGRSFHFLWKPCLTGHLFCFVLFFHSDSYSEELWLGEMWGRRPCTLVHPILLFVFAMPCIQARVASR